MNKLSLSLLILLLLNNCSYNEKRRAQKNKDIALDGKKNIKQIFIQEKIKTVEFNAQLKLDLVKTNFKNQTVENKNNYGSFEYKGILNKVGNYKFSKFNNLDNMNFKPSFLKEGLIFFDNKGSILRYDKNQNIIWKSNHYLKTEKKLKPKLSFAISDKTLLVVDNIAKLYLVDLNSGKLIWSKNNIYPFNSEIKVFNNNFFVVDYKNILRCYNINDGSECWNLQTEDSFTLSNNKNSLIILDNSIIFNNSIGDITSVNINTGRILWQLPTQNSSIVNEAYNFKNSKLVSDGESVFFSNNKNSFFSINSKNGTLNWTNKINSNLSPVILGNLIISVSNDGYLFVIDKKKGNIIRINDLYKKYKLKKRSNISPIGFVVGLTNIYLTSNDGELIVSDLTSGKVLATKKISNSLISKPFISNGNLFIIKNGSIIQYN